MKYIRKHGISFYDKEYDFSNAEQGKFYIPVGIFNYMGRCKLEPFTGSDGC
jgi:hypothetical protein